MSALTVGSMPQSNKKIFKWTNINQSDFVTATAAASYARWYCVRFIVDIGIQSSDIISSNFCVYFIGII